MLFEYVVFPLPDMRYIVSSLLDAGFSKKSIHKAFKYWLRHFYYRSKRFYNAQYRRHVDLLQRNFERICDQEFLEEDDNKKVFFDKNGLDEHMASKNYAIYELISHINSIAPELRTNQQKLYNIGEVLLSTVDELEASLEIPIHVFDELWFDSLINNQKLTRDGLRKLDYPDYLKTWHWKKVRAAMLLLNNCLCQHPECSVEQQDAIAMIILEELEDEVQWNTSFERSQDVLAKLAKKAMSEYQ